MDNQAQSDEQNYIVPAKLLVGVVVRSAQENVNEKATEVIKMVEQNAEIKNLLFDLSRKMTEIAEEKGMFVILPDFMPPEDNEQYTQTVSKFITEMVNNQNSRNQSDGSVIDNSGVIDI